MRSRTLTYVFAFLLGAFGIHRFYLAQNIRGALYLLAPSILILILGYTGLISDKIIANDFGPDWVGAIWIAPWPIYLIMAAIGLFDGIWFLLMKEAKFERLYNSGKKLNWTLAMSIAVPMILLIIIGNSFKGLQEINVRNSDADFRFSAIDLAEQFSKGGEEVFNQYHERVFEVTGNISNIETQFSEDGEELLIILNGNGDYHIKCDFYSGEQELILQLKKQDSVVIKGYLDEVLLNQIVLNNCILNYPKNQ